MKVSLSEHGHHTYQAVGAAIMAHIVEQRLAPGSPLPSEREFCQILGVSRTSVREGLRALTMIGLVEVRIGEGSFVRKVDIGKHIKELAPLLIADPQNILDLQEVREAMEVMAARRAATNITDEQLTELSQNLERYKEQLDLGEYGLETDVAFHSLIYRAGQNRFLQQLGDSITEMVHVIRVAGLRNLPRPYVAFHQHTEIYMALKARDPVAASAAMGVHMQQVRHNLLDILVQP